MKKASGFQVQKIVSRKSWDVRLDPLFRFLTKVREQESTQQGQFALLVQNDLKDICECMNSLSTAEKKCLTAQLQAYILEPTQTMSLIDDAQISFLAAFFSAPYATQMGFEFFEYRKLSALPEIEEKFSSIAMPVSILRSSAGLLPGRTVALFPENWVNKNSSVFSKADRVYYFINKFVSRYFNITKFLLETCCKAGTFDALKSASREEIEIACCNWVTIHEHFHRQGRLPLPEFLALKSSRSSAAIEELRVDVVAMLALPSLKSESSRILQISREFILAERLLRYAVEASPDRDYDAIGTQVLFQFLQATGGVSVEHGLLRIHGDIWSRVEHLSRMITELEMKAEKITIDEGKKIFQNFARKLGNYSFVNGRYETLSFFSLCKEKYERREESLKKAA